MEKELPKGWVETELGSILKLKNGYAFKSGDYTEEGMPVIRISDIQEGFVTTNKAVCVKVENIPVDFIVKKGDVLVAMSGATTGKFGVYNEEVIAYQNQRVGNLTPHSEIHISRRFIYYLFAGFKNEIEERAYGAAQPNISSSLIEGIPFNLPPKPEQERIVAKLDSLFLELERVKEGLVKIPVLMKNFRQAVLTQAVTGKLTEEWRVGKELGEWKETAIGSISKSISGYAFKSSDFVDEGIQLIRMGNLYNNKLDLSRNAVYLPSNFDSKIIEKYKVKKDDILLSLTGTKYKRDYGFAIKVENDFPLLLNQRILALRPNLNVDYFLYLLRDNIFRDQFFELETGGVNQGNVGVKGVLDIIIPVPPVEEQQELVRRVEALFAQADAIEARYALLKEKIEHLPQAILAKAFRGELVEQLPTDGDARELLEEIKKMKSLKNVR